jgi:ribokinase
MVHVIGNLVLDLLAWPVEKIRWDGTVWVEQCTRSLGGNGANTSYALAKLGCPVALHGAVGEEREGDELVALLKAQEVAQEVERKDNAVWLRWKLADTNVAALLGAD